MKQKQINVDKLTEIRQRLPKGSGPAIARALGISTTSVSNTLNGKMATKGVLEEAYKIIEAENKYQATLAARHNAVII